MYIVNYTYTENNTAMQAQAIVNKSDLPAVLAYIENGYTCTEIRVQLLDN